MYVFVGFWDGEYVRQLPYVWYYVVGKISFKHASPKGPMRFRCLMFSCQDPVNYHLTIFIAS